MSKTETNLQDAFAGESQANRKYLAWAKKAEQEGYKQVAKALQGCRGGRDDPREQSSKTNGRH